MKLLIGSSNKGKYIECSEALSGLGMDILSPSDVGIVDSPEEHGSTFEQNAREKARFYHEQTGLPTLADDSGIVVHALSGELGIHTRRWGAGKNATDEEWIEFFLQRMANEENKSATFHCVLCYIDGEGTEHYFEGRCEGTITQSLEASFFPGLPISACFKPKGSAHVYSALNVDEKNQLSHRGKAMRLFREFIRHQP